MSYVPPTLEEIREQIVSSIESKTGQKVPIYEKAFQRLLATGISYVLYPFYKYVSWSYKQGFAVSADEDNLENQHALDEGVSRSGAVKTEFTVELVVTSPALITKTTTFENSATKLRYFPINDKSVTVSDDTVDLIAEDYGTEYTVDVGDTLDVGNQISGVGSECTVDSIIVYAADKQDLESFRGDIVEKKSGTVSTGNSRTYRAQSQAVDGVARAYPFPGNPYDPINSKPGDRSVFIEADQSLGTDGIASTDLLNNVRSAIRIDPDTQEDFESLGLTNDTLYVSSVQHVLFDIYIYDLSVDASIEQDVKDAIELAIDEYFKTLSPYVYGLDPEYERNDNVSSITVSGIVNDLLKQYSATASNITIEEDSSVINNRLLIGGDLARANSTNWVSS